MKIIDKINSAVAEERTFYSFEFFPPKSQPQVDKLHQRVDRLAKLEPLFIDVTWGAGGSTSKRTIEIVQKLQKYAGLEVMMHLTCTNLPISMVKDALEAAKDAGVQNILALRGDPPKGSEKWEATEDGFNYAIDLVKYIRQEYGDYFGIAVAGYPEKHVESKSYEEDIKFLKQKVDAGADFVVSQLFYNVDKFFTFERDCRAAGITCPIIPGVMPIHTYKGFKRMTGFCKIEIPDELMRGLEAVKDSEDQVKVFGINRAVEMCQKLLESGVPGIHYYTLNMESSVRQVVQNLGLTADVVTRKAFPWRPSTLPQRSQEDVRPIFWANRHKSYMSRTDAWEKFPRGRWEDGERNKFADIPCDSGFFLPTCGTPEERRAMWGTELNEPIDIHKVFAAYLEGKIRILPWCDQAIHAETVQITQHLVRLNMAGILTINSQPRANAVRSEDPCFGWGGEGGRVFQKAYVEFFISPEKLNTFIKLVTQHSNLTYHAVNVSGETLTNASSSSPNAVTWGVFPDREILQPTVVDPTAFMAWKDEAFKLWEMLWAPIYSAGSKSHTLLNEVHDSYYLVNVVDNDFVEGKLFEILDGMVKHLEASETE
eukprot:TRINITY_DN5412_c0_g2_i1.p1 TRINITY_DN5412_c0_g2~~TRINITY_DN5412_c0_g2_i1.p1  ORF type:complete len:597 (-),score=203.32 TRINITY_DN5412_c0_g2_i1:321-2111(-)